jgi:hypothetical protein
MRAGLVWRLWCEINKIPAGRPAPDESIFRPAGMRRGRSARMWRYFADEIRHVGWYWFVKVLLFVLGILRVTVSILTRHLDLIPLHGLCGLHDL